MMMMVNKKQNKQPSKFSETCSKLSHLLKQRRSSLGLGDHHFPSNTNTNTNTNMLVDLNANAMSCAPTNTATTTTTTFMNLFPNKVGFQDDDDTATTDSNVSNSQQNNNNNNVTPLDLFPSTNSSLPLASSSHQSTQSLLPISREGPRSMEESQTSAPKMTIFYGGQVIVFDDLAEDKAEEIMAFATQLGTVASHSETPTQTVENSQALMPENTIFEHPTSSLFDLPMTRRVSLHRFIEKRKHRIASASPYQLQRSMHMDYKYELVRHI